MKVLVGIPVLYGPQHCREAIESVIDNENVTVLVIDNGSGPDMIDMLSSFPVSNYKGKLTIIRNPENVYVNPAWNQILDVFLNGFPAMHGFPRVQGGFDQLVIMNSDLVMCKYWYEVLKKHLTLFPQNIPVPHITTNKNELYIVNKTQEVTHVFEGTPGVFICLNQEHAALINPIPESIKVWFGDNWIYEGLRKRGYSTVVLSNLVAYHSGSQTVSRVPGISELIEQDKIEWEKLNK